MPDAQVNTLVHTYCAPCHTDASPIGALSFQHFDIAHSDPGVLSMMLSKLRTGALGAAGLPTPEVPVRRALVSAIAEKATGANDWIVSESEARHLTASIVRELPSSASETRGEPSKYRLILTCQPDTHQAEMQLTWSPGDVPKEGATIAVAVDAKPSSTYNVEYYKGVTRLSGPLPQKTLSVKDLFPNETVTFPFDSLPQPARQTLDACFAVKTAAR